MSDSSPETPASLPAPRRAPGLNPLASGVFGVFLGLIAGIAIGTQSAPKAPEARKPVVINVQVNGQSAQIVGSPAPGNGLDGAQHVIGSNGAKITMVEFGDYRCGYCRIYEQETFPKLRAEFVNTGKVRYAYRHTVSVGGDQTVAVANAAQCVAEQGKFWDFHELMFAEQARWDGLAPGSALNAALSSLSGRVGADTGAVLACVSAKRHAASVQSDITAAAEFGVTGTPSFVINGYVFSGALPLEVYKAIFKHFGVS